MLQGTTCDILNETARNLLRFNESYQYIDMHCHIDFACEPQAVAQEAQRRNIGLFSGTVNPRGYQRATALFGASENVRVGLGLHPWWVTAETFDALMEEFLALLPATRYINEVGLDFSPRFFQHKEAQVNALKSILNSLSQTPEKSYVISLHSTKAAGVVLDLLEETHMFKNATCIFHWFNGSGIELTRAIKSGCYFSVGERFLATKKGREYIKCIPRNRLLLETDLPSSSANNPDDNCAIFSSLQSAWKLVEELKTN